MNEELDDHRLDKFARSLRKSPTKWVANDYLWAAFASAFPAMAQRADQRRHFLAALESLACRDNIELPSRTGRRWDSSFKPAIPTSVYVPRDDPDKPKDWRTFPWHESLMWVNDLNHVSPETEQLLRRVHDGLTRNGFSDVVPLKYRSLQLTGKEKRLGELAKSTLFGEGRLSFELLGCLAEVPPLAYEQVGKRRSIILFENADSFSVARNTLRTLENPPYGYVGFGGGNGVAKSLPYLMQITPVIERIVYVGDLDYHGLKIATRAVRTAATFGLPPVQPAAEIHAAMLKSAIAFDQPQGWQDETKRKPSAEDIDDVASFVHEDSRESITNLLRNKRRIPEEVLGPSELLSIWSAR
ncbi:MAG: hypothetical protein MPJ50_18555 [Pirellulales bacterium]|nr:hypothetical protein [Pirellulales bacterium]